MPEDGLILGNGDLSISIYQVARGVVFRFGKSDVWDLRFDASQDPRPPHIGEIAHGIRDEGWRCGPYGGPAVSAKGTADAKRMQEICQGCPPSYKNRAVPCPKPVGELILHWPGDLTGMRISQRVEIERGTYRFGAEWDGGVRLQVEAAVPPAPNVLAVRWVLRGWRREHAEAQGIPPIWASLYRWADPAIGEFQARFYADDLRELVIGGKLEHMAPLPPPVAERIAGQVAIEQRFYPEKTYPEGFRYRLVPFAPAEYEMKILGQASPREARIQLFPAGSPAMRGWLAVGTATSADPGGLETASAELVRAATPGARAVDGWFDAARSAAVGFWAKSSVAIADRLIENLWYETLHARRCSYKAGKIPPGLFMPSSLADYTHWHGDYHTNYNYQSPFWGDYMANHFELGDAYFDGMKFMLQAGELIARRYYDARGAFIQLSNYPFLAEDDPLGAAPMGRMAYMTGWMAGYYWNRYRYAMDEAWLKAEGYPAIKACALFYLDFLKKGPDGFYHSFPSNQGEDGFTGNPKDYTDRPQVNQHIRYGLRIAIKAARVLKIDDELCGEWLDRLEHLAGDDGAPPEPVPPLDMEICAPEFSPAYVLTPDLTKPWPTAGNYLYDWYLGQYPWQLMHAVRSKEYRSGEGWRRFCAMVRRWRHPNGLLWAMSVGRYGHLGAWTESLGIIGPLQEMMLQAWSGVIRLFPAWPLSVDCAFNNLRAEGAFLVSGGCRKGRIISVRIVSERGGLCRIHDPFGGRCAIKNAAGIPISFRRDDRGILEIATNPGLVFTIAKRKK